jgi:hypothetical protein
MKASSITLIAFVMLALVIGLAVTSGVTFIILSEGALQKTSLQSNIYSMDHSLDAARLYMDTSMAYSLYQACYDNLKRGGLSEITPETGESGHAYLQGLEDQEFLDELAKTTKIYLNRYAEENYRFLNEYYVTIPTYSTVSISPEGDTTLTASALPATDEKMTTFSQPDSGEVISLYGSAEVSGKFDTQCLILFQQGKQLNTDIVSNLQTAYSEAMDSINKHELIANCPDRETCSEELSASFRQAIGQNLDTTETEGDYEITTEYLDSSVTVTSVDSGVVVQYIADIVQKVSIRQTDLEADYYPVWNGQELAFEKLELVYINALSGTIIDPMDFS